MAPAGEAAMLARSPTGGLASQWRHLWLPMHFLVYRAHQAKMASDATRRLAPVWSRPCDHPPPAPRGPTSRSDRGRGLDMVAAPPPASHPGKRRRSLPPRQLPNALPLCSQHQSRGEGGGRGRAACARHLPDAGGNVASPPSRMTRPSEPCSAGQSTSAG